MKQLPMHFLFGELNKLGVASLGRVFTPVHHLLKATGNTLLPISAVFMKHYNDVNPLAGGAYGTRDKAFFARKHHL